ncbi:nicalin-1-like protein isoform X3 [Tanacetum coccineum]
MGSSSIITALKTKDFLRSMTVEDEESKRKSMWGLVKDLDKCDFVNWAKAVNDHLHCSIVKCQRYLEKIFSSQHAFEGAAPILEPSILPLIERKCWCKRCRRVGDTGTSRPLSADEESSANEERHVEVLPRGLDVPAFPSALRGLDVPAYPTSLTPAFHPTFSISDKDKLLRSAETASGVDDGLSECRLPESGVQYRHSSIWKKNKDCKGLSNVAEELGVTVGLKYMKMNVFNFGVAWEQEQFLRLRVTAATLSGHSAQPDLLESIGGLFYNREFVNKATVVKSVKVVAESLVRLIYGQQGKTINIFADNSSLAVNPSYIRSWLDLMSRTPRVAPFLSRVSAFIMALKKELADHVCLRDFHKPKTGFVVAFKVNF